MTYLTNNNGSNNAPTATEFLHKGRRRSSCKSQWWKQFKEMSATCKAFEKEIEGRHFEYLMVDPAVDVGELANRGDGLVGIGLKQGSIPAESGSYNHENVDAGTGKGLPKKDAVSTSKVLVFSGRGSVVMSVAESSNRTMTAAQIRPGCTTFVPTPLAERNNVSEQLLVVELQN